MEKDPDRARMARDNFERAGEKGDQFVIIKIMVPRTLDAEDKQTVEKLARKHPLDARVDVPWK